MLNKRLVRAVPESRKYIAGNVLCQWVSLLANIRLMAALTALVAALPQGKLTAEMTVEILFDAVVAVAVRAVCTLLSSRLSYLSSKAVKRTLRGKIYKKLLGLGASYQERVNTSEVVQVAVEGVDQLETYFGSYLPQFFYAMLAPLTLFGVLSFVNFPAALVLFLCVPLIPAAIVAVQRWAKKLLSKYWGQYTALGDTFLENLQGLTTLKIYQADSFKHQEMKEQVGEVPENHHEGADHAAELHHYYGSDRLRRRGPGGDFGGDPVSRGPRGPGGLPAAAYSSRRISFCPCGCWALSSTSP